MQAGSELAREHDVTKGPPLSYLHTSRPSTIFDRFVFFFSRRAPQDVRSSVGCEGCGDEEKVAAIEKTRELLLARKNAVSTGHRADALLLKRSSKFQELHLVAGWELPDHVECSKAERVCRGGGVALGRMVSHFDEIEPLSSPMVTPPAEATRS